MTAIESQCDVAIVGGGPAGIAAATVAAEAGARVTLFDENAMLGGQIWRRDVHRGHGAAATRWLERLTRSAAAIELGVTIADAQHSAEQGIRLLACRDGRSWWVRARSVVLCTGARERFLPFPGWTLPGVLGAGGAQALVKSGMDVRGRTAVVAGSGPLLLAAAAGLSAAGARIVLVAEQATSLQVARYAAGLWRTPGRLGLAAAYRRAIGRARYATGHWVQRAEGDAAVERVIVSDGTRDTPHACDLLCTGYGLVPETRLAGLLACTSDGEAVRVDAFQRTSVPAVFAAGEPTGIGGVEMAVVEGQIAGFASGGRMAEAAALAGTLRAHRAAAHRMTSAFALRPALRALPRPDTILCRCEDVRFGAIDPALGFRSARLQHRIGMGACQGRICGDALCWLAGWTPEAPRPPVVPVPLSALASRVDRQPHSTD